MGKFRVGDIIVAREDIISPKRRLIPNNAKYTIHPWIIKDEDLYFYGDGANVDRWGIQELYGVNIQVAPKTTIEQQFMLYTDYVEVLYGKS